MYYEERIIDGILHSRSPITLLTVEPVHVR